MSSMYRVSNRFIAVCRAIQKHYKVSAPVASEMILDQFSKGGLIHYGDKVILEDIIEKVTKGTRDSEDDSPTLFSDLSLEKVNEKEKTKNSVASEEKTGDIMPVAHHNPKDSPK